MNAAAERMFYFTARRVVARRCQNAGQPITRSYRMAPRSRRKNPRRVGLAGAAVQGQVLVFPQYDGILLWVSASAGPIYAPDGRLLGAVATYTDITPLHQLQEQRETLHPHGLA